MTNETLYPCFLVDAPSKEPGATWRAPKEAWGNPSLPTLIVMTPSGQWRLDEGTEVTGTPPKLSALNSRMVDRRRGKQYQLRDGVLHESRAPLAAK